MNKLYLRLTLFVATTCEEPTHRPDVLALVFVHPDPTTHGGPYNAPEGRVVRSSRGAVVDKS